MSYARHLQTYRRTHTETIDSATLLIMLYQGAIDFVRQARESLARNNMADKGYFVMKALAIISELRISLDVKVGGDVALNLEQLYLFMLDQLTLGNLNNDPEPFTQVIELLAILKEGWTEAVMETRKQGMVVAQRKQGNSANHEHGFAARA